MWSSNTWYTSNKWRQQTFIHSYDRARKLHESFEIADWLRILRLARPCFNRSEKMYSNLEYTVLKRIQWFCDHICSWFPLTAAINEKANKWGYYIVLLINQPTLRTLHSISHELFRFCLVKHATHRKLFQIRVVDNNYILVTCRVSCIMEHPFSASCEVQFMLTKMKPILQLALYYPRHKTELYINELSGSGLVTWSENCKWHSSLCESV